MAPIYHTNSPEECRYVLEHAGSRVVFCENAEQVAKVRQVAGGCPDLEHIAVLDGTAEGALTLDELRARGANIKQEAHGGNRTRQSSQVTPRRSSTRPEPPALRRAA